MDRQMKGKIAETWFVCFKNTRLVAAAKSAGLSTCNSLECYDIFGTEPSRAGRAILSFIEGQSCICRRLTFFILEILEATADEYG